MFISEVGVDLTDNLPEIWEAFRKYRLFHGSCFANKADFFSLIFDAIGQDVFRVYTDCGFVDTQFNQLHLLLVKIEQLCLFNIFCALEKFRSPNKPCKTEATKMSSSEKESGPEVASEKSYPVDGEGAAVEEKNSGIARQGKVLGKRIKAANVPSGSVPSKKASISVAKDKRQVVDHQCAELGRGKRKKFTKVQFDVLDDQRTQKKALSVISKSGLNSNAECIQKTKEDRARRAVRKSKVVEENEPPAKKRKQQNILDSEKTCISEGEQKAGAEREEVIRDEQVGTAINVDINRSEKCSDEIKREDIGCDDEKQLGKNKLNEGASKEIEDRLETSVKEECKEESENQSGGGLSSAVSKAKGRKSDATGERTDFECDDEAPIICSLCKEKVPKSRDLFRHWKQVHKAEHETNKPNAEPPSLFYCEVCQESFRAPRRFKLHYRIHSGARPHPCKLCGKSFRIYKGLTDHMMSHTKEKPFPCPQCPKRFVNKKLLNHHIKAHNNEIIPRVCEMCGKQYKTSLGLRLHYRVHAGLRPHKCDVCGIAFTQRCSLQIHKRLHTGDKRHICDVCGWRFNTNTALTVHKRVHTGERPYKCSQCPFQAASSSCVKAHEIVHTKEKPFPCIAPGCHKHFKRQVHLMCHLKKQHSGLKPYQCTLCGSKFAMVSELSHHEKSNACDGGRIKTERSPEPDLPTPHSTHVPSEALDSLDETNQGLIVLTGGEEKMEDDGPRIHRRRNRKPAPPQAPVTQEIHVSTHPVGMQQDAGEDQIVIHIVSEPGTDGTEIALSEEEMAAIVRLSQQMCN